MLYKIVGGTKVPENEKSWERKFLGTKGPWNESWNFRSPGTFVPGNEKSRERKFPIGTIRSWERKVLGTKSPGTIQLNSTQLNAKNGRRRNAPLYPYL